MEEILNGENKIDINHNEYLKSKKLLLEILNSHSYNDIMTCLINQDSEKCNTTLDAAIKNLVDNIDIELLTHLLMDEEIINNKKTMVKDNNKNLIQKTQSETIQSSFDSNLKLENDCEKTQVKKRKERKKPKPKINKLIYRKENNFYIYRVVAKKKEIYFC